MRGRPLLRTIRLKPVDPSLLRSLLLALFFLTGSLVGYLCARSWDSVAQTALSGYLTDYCTVYDAGGVTASAGSCVILYFGYTVLTFLLGFASVGVVLIPALAGVFGFLTMYTVSGFVCCFGRQGVLLAMGGAHYPPSFYIAVLFCHGRSGMAAVYGVEYAHIWSWPAFGSSSVWEPLFYSLCVVCCDSYSWRFLRKADDPPPLPARDGGYCRLIL